MDLKQVNPRIIGAVIGFVFGIIMTRTFTAALFTAGLGYFIGNSFNDVKSGSTKNGNLDYIKELLALVSVILTKDKKLLQSELNFVKRFLKHNFSEEEAKTYLLIFRDYNKKNFSIEKICSRLNLELNQSSKRQVLHLVIGAAVADRELTKAELADLYLIGRYLNISAQAVDALLSLHHFTFEGQTRSNYSRSSRSAQPRYSSSLKNAYQILELTESASEAEIKKAYRKLVVIYHPDKVSQMGESFQKSAKEKFQKVQDAYEQIKTARNMK